MDNLNNNKINNKKMKRHSFLARAAMMLLVMLLSTVTAWAKDWNGDGTLESPYLINNKADFKRLATKVNNGNYYSNEYFRLTTDLDFTGEDGVNPIGNGSTSSGAFNGTFDGAGHTISNISINSTMDYVAVFGWVYTDGVVKNLVLANSSITRSSIGATVGGLVGRLHGTVTNCFVTGVTVTTSSSMPGIICGRKDSEAVLSGNYYYNCTASGKSTSIGCYNADVTDSNGAVSVHTLTLGTGVSATASVAITYKGTDYYAKGTSVALSSSVANADGVIFEGYSVNGSTISGTSFTMPAKNTTVDINATDLWGVLAGAVGSSLKPYTITTTAGLNLLAENVNAGSTYSGKYFVLAANIAYDSNVTNNFTPIGSGGANVFSGNFDGKGYCVSGININEDSKDYIGIFGYASSATISNLVVNNCTLTGSNYVGGIVGKMTSGTLSNCLVISTKVYCPNTCGLIAGSFSGTLSNNLYDALCWLNSSSGLGYGVNSSNNDNAYLGVRIMAAEGVGFAPAETASATYASSGFKVYPSGLMYQNVCYKKILTNVTLHITYNGTIEQGYALEGFKAYGSMMSEASGSDNYSVYLSGMADCVIEPYIAIQYWTGAGTEADPYLITSVVGMNHLAEEVNNGNTYENKHFALGADLEYDRSVENNFTPIGDNPKFFKGNLDGRGHTISGVNVLRAAGVSREVGIIGYSQGAHGNIHYIRNLTVVNSSFVSTNRDNVAAICGSCEYTKIENCHVGEDVYISGRNCVGGIAGSLSGDALGCSCGATVVAQEGSNSAGGICGDNYDTVKDCIYYGKSVSAKYKGAIAGYLYKPYSPVVKNCYYTTYGIGGVNSSDTNGAHFAMVTNNAPSDISAATKTYGSGSYTGITVYDNALYYKGQYYWYDADLVILEDGGEENAARIASNQYSTVAATRNVVLAGRTLQAGGWNTFCAPFEISSAQIESVFGSEVKVRTLSSSSLSNDVLTLNFAEATTIEAGKPYLVKVASTVADPVFNGVSIVDGTTTIETAEVNFVPVMNPTELTAGDKSVLFIKGGNTLTYPTATANMNGFRAYFQLLNANNARSFNMNFDDGETATGIIELTNTNSTNATNSYYDLQGRKVANPTKGLYIVNGKKIVK